MSRKDKYLFQFTEIEWEQQEEFRRFKTLTQDGVTMTLVEISKGYRPTIWTNEACNGFVVEGMLGIDFPKETIMCYEGWGILIPEGDKYMFGPHSETVTFILFEGA